MADYREFLNLLEFKNTRGVIFEPFPNRKIVSQLIWREGANLWDTTPHRVSTLIDYYAYIKSDVAIIESMGDLDEILASSHLLADGMKFVIISDDPFEIQFADSSELVCAVATRGEFVKTKKPLICLSLKGENPEETIKRAFLCENRFAGAYLGDGAENFVGKYPILGGLGLDYINSSEPLVIYKRIAKLAENRGWAVGSGGYGEPTNYLGYISMLGMYNKLI